MHNVSDRPKILFYEGREGLEKVYEDTLTSHEPIRAYATYDDMEKALPGYFPEYFYRRAKKGIPIRAIFPFTQAGIDLSNFDEAQKRQTAMIPADKYYFSPEINIYDNKVMIASWKEKLGIIIESNEIADAMKKIFELSWTEAQRLDRELRGEKTKLKMTAMVNRPRERCLSMKLKIIAMNAQIIGTKILTVPRWISPLLTSIFLILSELRT